MKSFLRYIILVLVAIVAVSFAVINDQPARLAFVPFVSQSDVFTYNLPLWLVIFVSIGLGVIVGGAAAWLAQSKHRRAAREARAEIRLLRSELDRVRAQVHSPGAPALLNNRSA
jgi:uncharacterized integral membrane protein